jgi:hypothetical protein
LRKARDTTRCRLSCHAAQRANANIERAFVFHANWLHGAHRAAYRGSSAKRARRSNRLPSTADSTAYAPKCRTWQQHCANGPGHISELPCSAFHERSSLGGAHILLRAQSCHGLRRYRSKSSTGLCAELAQAISDVSDRLERTATESLCCSHFWRLGRRSHFFDFGLNLRRSHRVRENDAADAFNEYCWHYRFLAGINFPSL